MPLEVTRPGRKAQKVATLPSGNPRQARPEERKRGQYLQPEWKAGEEVEKGREGRAHPISSDCGERGGRRRPCIGNEEERLEKDERGKRALQDNAYLAGPAGGGGTM